jgi:hypothetical protein
LVHILERAAQDGHTLVPRSVVDAAWVDGKPVRNLVDASGSDGVIVVDDWVALAAVAAAENAVADELLGLAAEDRLAVLLTASSDPAADDALVIPQAGRLGLPELAAALQGVPRDRRVIVCGDPDELAGPEPGAALRDLVESGLVPFEDRRLDERAGSTALVGLVSAIRAGRLPEPDPSDQSLVVVPCEDDGSVVRRTQQLVHDSIPRVFGIDPGDVLVLTPLRRGVAGVAGLSEALGSNVRTVHESVGRRAPAVVACFPGQASGVFSRALVYSAAVAAERHLSVVTSAGGEVSAAVANGGLRGRRTRLRGLLTSRAEVD